MGPSSAPRNPPLCTIFFFAANDVFFSASLRSECLWRFNRLLCSGDRLTLPTRTFFEHSQMHFINSGLQCFFISAFRTLGEDFCNTRKYGVNFFNVCDILPRSRNRSEEHTSELQSLAYLVCRLLLEKKKNSLRVGEV